MNGKLTASGLFLIIVGSVLIAAPFTSISTAITKDVTEQEKNKTRFIASGAVGLVLGLIIAWFGMKAKKPQVFYPPPRPEQYGFPYQQ